MTSLRALIVAVPLWAGCGEPLPAIVLDISKNCNEAMVVPIDERLGDATAFGGARDEVLDVTTDGSSVTSSWQIVRRANETATDVVVRHVVDGRAQLELAPPVQQDGGGTLRLAPSPVRGEVYVVYQAPGVFRLARIADDTDGPVVQTSADLASSFPHDTHTCNPCDTTSWHRDLAFLDGLPYLVSVPPMSPDVSISVHVGTLSEPVGTSPFFIVDDNRLNFQPLCEPGVPREELELCEATMELISYPNVEVLAVQQDPRPATWEILATREQLVDGDPTTTRDVFLVHLYVDMTDEPKGVLRSEATTLYEIYPPGPPSGVVVDAFATYVLFTTQLGGTRLLRLPGLDANFEDLTPQLDLDDSVSLLQLDLDVALGRIDADGRLAIDKLFPDAPSQSQRTIYEGRGPIAALRPAGPSALVLQRPDDAGELVHLRCADPESSSAP